MLFREAAAAGVLEVVKEDTQTNLADLFTKVLPADRRRELLGSMLYNLWWSLTAQGFQPLDGFGTSCATCIVGQLQAGLCYIYIKISESRGLFDTG